jgi:hypothetical protein
LKKAIQFLVAGLVAVLVCLSITGCSGSSWRFDPGIPEKITELQASSGVNLVALSWKANAKATSYNIYYVSEIIGNSVTRANAVKIANVTTSQYIVSGLDNNITYYFMVTGVNRDGESVDSMQVSATPGPIGTADLNGTWYFHTLVTGPDAKWERGTVDISDGTAVISEFEDSSGNTQAPPGFTITADGSGDVSQSGEGAWIDFHGSMGSRKEMIVGTFSPTLSSRAITIFQKKKAASDYSIADIMGTGSGQNPNDPNLNGNGPTRLSYHQLYSGSKTGWEYCNAKVGQKGQFFTNDAKDVIYWDFSSPEFKSSGYDFFWKATSLGIDSDGLVKEYWNFSNVVDPLAGIYDYNDLTPKQPHDMLFTGRMTADKTVVVGVSTRTDANGQNPQYFLRIMELCFKPADQTLAEPSLNDLKGRYSFYKIGYADPDGTGSGVASWAYGVMNITASGETSFPQYADSLGNNTTADGFTLSYYPDPNPDGKVYKDFANFTTPALDGSAHYIDPDGNLLRMYYDFSIGYIYDSATASYKIDYSKRRQLNIVRDANNNVVIDPLTNKPKLLVPGYYNEHGTLSYNRDLFVMTRTDASGNAIIIGLK